MFIYQPPEPERKVKSTEAPSLNRRLEETIDHVAKGWIPVNPQVLKQVQEKIGEGVYRSNPASLVADLKNEPGLFLHAVKNLKQLAADTTAGMDPVVEILKLEEEKLRKIFSVTERQISAHRFRDMRKIQAVRYQHSVISARAAELIAPKVQLSGDLAFTSSLLRQLGHYLVSWNYPDIYARAASAQRTKGASLELELTKYLGISPLQIAAKFASSWNLHPDLKLTVAPPRRAVAAPQREEPLLLESGGSPRMTLQKLCEVSELFAQANDPENYPQASKEWASIGKTLQDELGSGFAAEIKEAVISSISLTDANMPQPLDPPFFKRPAAESPLSPRARQLISANTFLRRCPERVQKGLMQVYEQISQAAVCVDGLRLLVDKVTPQAGFLRGCLYVLEQNSLTLRPVLRIGDAALSAYPHIAVFENSPIAEALYTSVPLKQEGKSVTGTRVLQICGPLGSPKRPGVLYLELGGDEIDGIGHGSFICFQAVRQALLDCLGDSF